MSTIQWRLSLEVEDNGREVEGVAVVDVEAAHVLTEKQLQELWETEEKVNGFLWVGEMGNLRFVVGVWDWVLRGFSENFVDTMNVAEGDRDSMAACYGFVFMSRGTNALSAAAA